MDIKHREVVQWLREVYGEERIPAYEKNERSINLLHKLMTESKRAESQGKTLTADYKKKTAEYNAEAQQIQKWRETTSIEPGHLSQENQKALSALIHTSQVLDVQTSTSTNIILAMNQFEMEKMQVMNEQEQVQTRKGLLLEMNKDLSKKLQEIGEIVQQAEETWKIRQEDFAKDAKWKQFSKEKSKNYSADINKLQAKLNHVGLTKEITHGHIWNEWTRLQTLEKELFWRGFKVKSLEKQLGSYNLPPDISLAEVRVQEARQELTAIMQKLAENCSMDPI